MSRGLVLLIGALLVGVGGCGGDDDEMSYHREGISDRQAYREREYREASKKRKIGSVARFVPYVGGFAGSALHSSAADHEMRAQRDYMEEIRERQDARADAMTAASVNATNRASDRADEAARDARAERAEANRDRSFPASEISPAARRIADTLIDQLPRSRYVREYIEKNDSKLVLTTDLAESKARHTTAATVDNLMNQVMTQLSSNATIQDYFTVVADRARAEAMVRRSEGASSAVIKGSGDKIDRYDTDMLIAVSLVLYENDRRGSTTWDVHFEALNPKTREFLIQRQISIP